MENLDIIILTSIISTLFIVFGILMYKELSNVMESDGMYFPEEVKEQLKEYREEMHCEYSGLPSPKSYQNN